jgi:hypothetical protein
MSKAAEMQARNSFADFKKKNVLELDVATNA